MINEAQVIASSLPDPDNFFNPFDTFDEPGPSDDFAGTVITIPGG